MPMMLDPRSSGPSGLERIGTDIWVTWLLTILGVAPGLRAWRGLEPLPCTEALGMGGGSSGPSGLERIGTLNISAIEREISM